MIHLPTRVITNLTARRSTSPTARSHRHEGRHELTTRRVQRQGHRRPQDLTRAAAGSRPNLRRPTKSARPNPPPSKSATTGPPVLPTARAVLLETNVGGTKFASTAPTQADRRLRRTQRHWRPRTPTTTNASTIPTPWRRTPAAIFRHDDATVTNRLPRPLKLSFAATTASVGFG